MAIFMNNEYIKRVKENKTLQKCTFLMKVKKLHTKWKMNKCFQKGIKWKF
jgi:hypothetical protein